MTKNKFLKSLIVISSILIGSVLHAQMKLGNNPTSINSNAILEMESTNKGMLLPRLSLTSTTAASPLLAHVMGMTVYNTTTAGDVTPGFYYNDGAKWVRIASPSSANNTTSGPLVTIGNGTGATFTAMTVSVDTTAMKSFISSAVQNGAIVGKNTTSGSLVTITNGAGATLTAMTVSVDTTALKSFVADNIGKSPIKDSVSSTVSTVIQAGTVTGQNLTAGSLLQTTGTPTGASLKTAGYQVDTTALKSFLNNAGYDNTTDFWQNNGTATYTNSGNVAIGTTNPLNFPLYVYRSVPASSAASEIFSFGDSINRLNFFSRVNTGNYSGGATKQNDAVLVLMENTTLPRGLVVGTHEGDLIRFSKGRMTFTTSNSGVLTTYGSAERMILDSLGNLGIGALSPTNRLHISAPTNPLRLQGLQNGTFTDSILSVNSTGVVRKIPMSTIANSATTFWGLNGNDGTTPPSDLGASVAGNNFVGTTNAADLVFGTDGIARAILNQNGSMFGGVGSYDLTVNQQTKSSFVWGNLNLDSSDYVAIFGNDHVVSPGSNYSLIAGRGNHVVNGDGNAIFGLGNVVSAPYNLVGGTTNVVKGMANAVVGDQINAFGQKSGIFGAEHTDSAGYSIIGGTDNILSPNSGNSIVVGGSNRLKGSSANSAVFGTGNDLSGSSNATLVAGSSNIVTSGLSLVSGTRNTLNSTAHYSVVGGSDHTIDGEHSATFGELNTIEASHGLVSGSNHFLGSVAINSIVGGDNNEVHGPYSAVFGSGHLINAPYTLVAGQGHFSTTRLPHSTILGRYSKLVDSALLVVGNGNSVGTRSNAMVVMATGKVGINLVGTTIAPTNTLHINGTVRIDTLPMGAATDSIVTVGASGVMNKMTISNLSSSLYKTGRVACAGTATQVISNTAVSATGTILVTYEDAGALISTSVSARAAGSSFTVKFATVPPTSAFINYTIFP